MKFPPRLLVAGAFALGAGAAQADQVFNDDVIITFSLCVGNDCVNGENFGFDTIRLKENNTRLKFDDTSSSSSFPRNDWQLTANDTTNGGAEKFSIDDITNSRTPFTIEAGTRSNQLYVDSSNRVGFGTNTPVVDLHVRQGNTPTLRLEQDGSSGFTAQTWDVAGNEANFFVRDATNGSRLPFKIKPSAPTDSLFVATDGDVGLGTAAPAGKLHTRGSGVQLVYFESTDNAVQVRMRTDSQNRRFLATDSSDAVKSQIVFGDTSIKLAGATDTGANLWAVIDANGITTLGPDCSGAPCDATFDPEAFAVPSIEDHAEYMWGNRHLWAVGPTGPDQPFNLTEKTAGMLHELEVAHIYIDQLNQRVKELETLVLGLK